MFKTLGTISVLPKRKKKKKGNKRFIMETTLKPFILKISQYKMSTHTDAAVTL